MPAEHSTGMKTVSKNTAGTVAAKLRAPRAPGDIVIQALRRLRR